MSIQPEQPRVARPDAYTGDVFDSMKARGLPHPQGDGSASKGLAVFTPAPPHPILPRRGKRRTSPATAQP